MTTKPISPSLKSKALDKSQIYRAGELDQTITIDDPQVVDHKSPVPLYFQLYNYINQKIKAREWLPGQLLPSEQELCTTIGVSRTVVRQAIEQLQRDRLILKQNGKRSSIALPTYEGDLMENLRGFYEDAIAKGRTPLTEVLSLKVVPATPDIAVALRLSQGTPVVELNRLRFLDGEPEVLVITYLPESICPDLPEEDLANESLYMLLARKYGLRIAQAFRTIEAVALDRTEAKLLRSRPGSPALLLKSIGLLADGTPLEYFIARHRGDRAKFQVKLVGDQPPG
jgi:GntR family transcriptional regulator